MHNKNLMRLTITHKKILELLFEGRMISIDNYNTALIGN